MQAMDRAYIEQNNVVQRYRSGKLTAEENEAFEVYLLDKPTLVEELELDAILADGLSKSALAPHNNVQQPTQSQGLWGIRWLTANHLWASCCTLLVALLLIQPGQQPAQIQGANQVVYLDTLRSSNQSLTQVTLAKNSQQLVLFIPANPGQKGPFNVELQNAQQQAQFSQSQVPLSNTGDLVLTLKRELLNTGQYQLQITDLPTQTQTSLKFGLVME